ncbi:MAG: hypothetical protein HW390_3098 [Candidatus Brocadiaceae bacterium]|nr:hypothetical protein [Candidatus Brocadiaceae bacterium]
MLGEAEHAYPVKTAMSIFNFEYPTSKGDAFENEIDKRISFLKTRDADDIKMCYQMLTILFGHIEKNYHHTGFTSPKTI